MLESNWHNIQFHLILNAIAMMNNDVELYFCIGVSNHLLIIMIVIMSSCDKNDDVRAGAGEWGYGKTTKITVLNMYKRF